MIEFTDKHHDRPVSGIIHKLSDLCSKVFIVSESVVFDGPYTSSAISILPYHLRMLTSMLTQL